MTTPPGFTRSHTWYPHPDAWAAATAVERFMDPEDYLDRYLVRVKEAKKTPTSGEFLTWFLDDHAAAIRRERRLSRDVEVADDGTPLSWGRKV